MTKAIKVHPIALIGIPLFLIASLVFLVKSQAFQLYPEKLSLGITLDLVLTLPIIYMLLIWNRSIPKFTVVPFFIGGIVIASFILPDAHQFHLSMVKKWVLPIVELTIFSIIIYKVVKTVRLFKKEHSTRTDFLECVQSVANQVIPNKVISNLFATEISVIYYGFFNWKTYAPGEKEFTYHKKTSTVLLLAVFIFLIVIEGAVVHLLLQTWSTTAAWILSGISIYTAIQVFAMAKSLSKRPMLIGTDSLDLKYGILANCSIPYEMIESAEVMTVSLDKSHDTKWLSPFGEMEGNNVIITLKKTHTIRGMYGLNKTCKRLLLFIDENSSFVDHINRRISYE